MLAVNGDKVHFHYSGTLINPPNAKFLKITFEGTTLNSNEITGDTGDWRIEGWLQRVSASVLRYMVQMQTATTRYAPDYGEVTGLNLDTTDYDLTLKVTTSDAAGDVTAKMAHGLFIPAASTNTDWILDWNGEPILDHNGDQIAGRQ